MDLRIGPQPDEERTRNFESEGIKYRMVAKDPYGHVKVTCITKNKNLDGVFTSFLEGEKAAKQHAAKLAQQKAKDLEKKVAN